MKGKITVPQQRQRLILTWLKIHFCYNIIVSFSQVISKNHFFNVTNLWMHLSPTTLQGKAIAGLGKDEQKYTEGERVYL